MMELSDSFLDRIKTLGLELLSGDTDTLEMREPAGHFITKGETPDGDVHVATVELEHNGTLVPVTVYLKNGTGAH